MNGVFNMVSVVIFGLNLFFCLETHISHYTHIYVYQYNANIIIISMGVFLDTL